MKKKHLILFSIFLLSCTLVFPLFLTGSAESFDLTVYLSSNGSSTNSGLTEEKPVSTFLEALATAKSTVGDSNTAKVRFVLLDDITVANDPYGTVPYAFQLTVTGKTGSEAIIAAGTYVHHVCDTRYEKIHFTQASTSNYAFLCANGYNLVMGEGITCSPRSNGYYLNLTGGNYGSKGKTFHSDSSLTVLSGEWETLYAGCYKGNQTGNATLYAENCKIHTNVGTCYTEDHTGTSTITLKNCEVAIKSSGMLQGGPTNAAGTLSGKLTLTVEDCAVRDFGVGYKCAITSPLSLTVKNSTVRDAYSVTATGNQEIHLAATAGKTLDLTPAKDIQATSFIGGGTLVLGSESTLKVGTVSGSTTLDLGETPALRAYVRAASSTPNDAFTYVGTPEMKIRIVGEEKIWTLSSAVILKTPKSVSLTLHTKFSDGEEVPADDVRTENGENFYTFFDLPAGNYRYVVKGTGYYQVTKNLYLSEEKLKNDFLLDCTPPMMDGDGFEPCPTANPNVKDYTDEMRENLLKSDPSNWPEYSFIFKSPYFTRSSYEKGIHQATTQDEMMAYIEKCVAANENLYLYTLGKSPVNRFDIPVLIFTTSDLSKAKTLEDAAEIVNKNEKLTFQYQAQVHGNEPAAGEGALAMIGALSSDWGKRYADDLNICIIPRINTDGSYAYTRNQVSQKRNLNRDYLLVEAEEIPMILQAYNLFRPEIVVDGHEFTVSTSSTSGAFNDVSLGTGGNESMDGRFEENGLDMMLQAFDHLKKNGLNSHFYTSQDDSADPTTARAYYQMRGSVSLLLETGGIHTGQNGIHRRVVSQFLCMETYLDYAKEHKAELRALCADVRAKLEKDGSTYNEDRLFALETETVAHSVTYPKTVYSYVTGLATGTKNATAKSEDDVQRSRPLPTAYVIPKDENSEVILRIAKAHCISYYELEADSAAYLYGYKGAYTASSNLVSDITLSEESLVSFPNGAYVFPMNQDSCLILASMFEPDNDDIYNTSDRTFTLAQRGTIPCENGSFSMYRSQRALTDGKIEAIPAPSAPAGLSATKSDDKAWFGTINGFDPSLSYEIRHETESSFTAVPAGSTKVSGVPFGFVEIRLAAKGDTPASKITKLEITPPSSALPTVYLAPISGSDADFGTENDPVKTIERAVELLMMLKRYSTKQNTLIFAETLSTTSAVIFPNHDDPLYITSKSGSEGIRSSKNITFGGETVVDNFTFTYTAKSYHYIVANGHKVTLGENVKSVGEQNVYYMPVGGGHESAVESTDMTILGGTWRNIYAGGYRGSIEGDTKLTVKNCTVVSHIQNSYSGRTEGNVTIDLENVTVQTSFLCGNAATEDVRGNVTLYAKNCTLPLLYAGSRDAGNVTGRVTVTLENCTAGDLYGTAKSVSATVAESHLTLIDTEPDGQVTGWTSVTHKTSALKGDADGSGNVDMDDAIYLLFHINFPASYPIEQTADYDGNGKVDTDDAIYLLFHVNFPASYPLH